MGIKKEIWEWTRAIAVAVIVAALIRLFLFEVYVVEGSSMAFTLAEHERVVVNKLAYRLSDPSPGDIVVFKFDRRQDFIKRVIGVEGESIEISGGRVYRNGLALEEPYLQICQDNTGDFGPVEVPPGYLFVLGDNRPISEDSRSSRVGFISLENIKGRARLVFWPLRGARIVH